MNMNSLAGYKKTITASVGAIIAFATLVITSDSGPITSAEWLSGGIGLATALGVYGVSNEPDDRGQVNWGGAIVAICVVLAVIFVLQKLDWIG